MRLGPSLGGALVGAVVGACVLVVVERSFGTSASWVAIPLGLLAGMGARMMAGQSIKNPNYVRGGLTAAIALLAFLGGSFVSAQMLTSDSAKEVDALMHAKMPVVDAPVVDVPDIEIEEDEPESETSDESAEGETETSDQSDTAAEIASQIAAQNKPSNEIADVMNEGATQGKKSSTANRQPVLVGPNGIVSFSAIQFILIALGVFLAYELARGGSNKFTGSTDQAQTDEGSTTG